MGLFDSIKSFFGVDAGKANVGGAVASLPKPPTINEIAEQFQLALPRILAAEKEFGPQLAELQLQQAEQFTPRLNDLLFKEQSRLYPLTSQLQELLAGQAIEGSQSGLPKAIQDQYLDLFRANLGSNVGSPIGSDYLSSNMISLQEARKDQFRNLGLSLLGLLPPTQGQLANPVSATGGVGITDAINLAANTYSPFVSATSNLLNTGIAGQYSLRQQALKGRQDLTQLYLKAAASGAAGAM